MISRDQNSCSVEGQRLMTNTGCGDVRTGRRRRSLLIWIKVGSRRLRERRKLEKERMNNGCWVALAVEVVVVVVLCFGLI